MRSEIKDHLQKRGEGRSLRGALRPRTTPLAPDGEEPFETFERNHMKREETDEELQVGK